MQRMSRVIQAVEALTDEQRAEMAAAGVKARAPDAKPWDHRAIIELWRVAAQCEGIAQRAGMAAYLAAHLSMTVTFEMVGRIARGEAP